MIYGSVCSGIEAASVAWKPLGWRAAFLSEIEAFPRAVLEHHYPDIPCHGDFTTIQEGFYDRIDLLVGGTPCQDFSIAGLRAGITGARGNLTLEFVKLVARLHPRWVVWENVPGVLSSNGGRAFGAFLGALGELGYGFAYRVLDAQYFGLAQRRKRVFVVGYLGNWRRAAAVLFEHEGLRGDPAPRRETGQRVADSLTVGANQCSGFPKDFTEHIPAVSPALKAWDYKGPSSDGDGDGAPLIAHALRAQAQASHRADTETFVTHSLRGEGFDASEDGTGRGIPLTVAFSCKDHGADAADGIAPTMRAMGHTGSHANAGGQLAVAFNLRGRDGGSQPEPTDLASLRASSGGSSRSYVAQSAVRRLTPKECCRLQGFPDDYLDILYRGKPAADGPRYRALGNSMAVPVMAWIGRRIQLIEDMTS